MCHYKTDYIIHSFNVVFAAHSVNVTQPLVRLLTVELLLHDLVPARLHIIL